MAYPAWIESGECNLWQTNEALILLPNTKSHILFEGSKQVMLVN